MTDDYTDIHTFSFDEAVSPLSQRADESLVDYHKRLVYGKLVDKTLSDIDYSEIAEAVYGKPYSSDVARRMLYGSRKTYEELDVEKVTHEIECAQKLDGEEKAVSYIDDLEAKTVQMRKEAQRLADQKREYKKLITAEGRFEHLESVIAESVARLSDTVDKYYTDLHYERADISKEAVLVFSDWHYGLVADNIFNKFNTDICKDRVQSVVNQAICRITDNECGVLNIVVLGDLIHGAIHTSTRVASEELACDQLIHASELLAQAIDCLSRYVLKTNVYITYGNHGRSVQNKNDSIHRDNFERVVPWWLTERFKNRDDIYIKESDTEFVVFDVCGYGFCAAHGDLDNVHTSSRTLSTLIRKTLGVDLEYILLGDKHHIETFDEIGVTSTICGSLCGTDDYANNKRLYAVPSQLLLIVNAVDGVDAEYRLKCSR